MYKEIVVMPSHVRDIQRNWIVALAHVVTCLVDKKFFFDA